MAAAAAKEEDHKSNDFYAVLGLKKDCTAPDLRIAYKKLALQWHPDRCSASTSEAKQKFQDIQEAYSVLADANKRFLYDVGVYDSEDHDDENGMADFLNEMAEMMTQNKSNNENGKCESFEQLQHLFNEMFQDEIHGFTSSSPSSSSSSSCSRSTTPSETHNDNNGISNKRNSVESTQFQGFSIGTGGTTSSKHQIGEASRKKSTTRKFRR